MNATRSQSRISANTALLISSLLVVALTALPVGCPAPALGQTTLPRAQDTIQDGKDSVYIATAVALPANTRDGNVLTASVNGALGTIDGVSPELGKRILVQDEVSALKNGIYKVLDLGSVSTKWRLARTEDADQNAEVTSGLSVFVERGTTNGGKTFVLTTVNPITLNTTALVFTDPVVAGAPAVTEGAVRTALAASTGAVALNSQSITSVNLVDGRDVSTDGTKLDGIEAGADNVSESSVRTALAASAGAITLNGVSVSTVGNLSLDGTLTTTNDITPTTLAGNVNDYSPTSLSTAAIIRLSGGAADRTISGLTGGADGREITIHNIGTSNALTLLNDDSGSTSTNRFLMPLARSYLLSPGAAVKLIYDATSGRWRLSAGTFANPMTTANDLIVGGTSGTAARLAAPTSAGGTLRYVNSTLGWVPMLQPRYEAWIYEEFASVGQFNFPAASSGAAAGVTIISGSLNHPTAGRCAVGTTNTGRCAWMLGSASALSLGAGGATFESAHTFPVLSTAGERFYFVVGFQDALAGGEPVDGIYIRYSDDVNSGNYQCIARAASSETVGTGGSSIPPVATVYQTFSVVLNAAATSAECFVNGTSIGTVASNIPTGANLTGAGSKMEKTVGTTTRNYETDFQALWVGVAR